MYEVQTYTLVDGWVNCWHELDDNCQEVPVQFKSYVGAQEAMIDYINETREECKKGNLESPCDVDEIRIEEVSND